MAKKKLRYYSPDQELYINFGKYIGDVKGEDPGAEFAEERLGQAHEELYRNIQLRRRKNAKEGDIIDLERELNAIFFPKETGDLKVDFKNTFISMLNKGYNTAYKDKVSKASTLENVVKGNLTKTRAKQIAKEAKKAALKKSKEEIKKQNVTIEVMARNIQSLRNIEKTLEASSPDNLELFKTVKKDFEEKISAISEVADKYITEEYYNEMETKEDAQRLKDYTRLIREDRRGEKSIADLKDSLNYYIEFYEAIKELFVVTPATLGNYFEYALALCNLDLTQVDEKTLTNKMAKKVKEDFIKGGTLVKRQGTKFSKENAIAIDFAITDMDIKSTISDDYKKETITVLAPALDDNSADISYANVDLDFIENIDTGSDGSGDKQSKVDVTVTLPTGNLKEQPFRISAKNWSQVLDKERIHDLGTTSVLAGVDRSLATTDGGKREALWTYIYVLQHPDKNRREPGEKALMISHKLAKEAIVADIAMGLSQGDANGFGYADTLVVLDRSRKHVFVADIVQEILKFMDDTLNDFEIEGYDDKTLEIEARTLRAATRAQISYSMRDKVYRGLMTNMLHKHKVRVLYLPRLEEHNI